MSNGDTTTSTTTTTTSTSTTSATTPAPVSSPVYPPDPTPVGPAPTPVGPPLGQACVACGCRSVGPCDLCGGATGTATLSPCPRCPNGERIG